MDSRVGCVEYHVIEKWLKTALTLARRTEKGDELMRAIRSDQGYEPHDTNPTIFTTPYTAKKVGIFPD